LLPLKAWVGNAFEMFDKCRLLFVHFTALKAK
jgi:hypothetical protein